MRVQGHRVGLLQRQQLSGEVGAQLGLHEDAVSVAPSSDSHLLPKSGRQTRENKVRRTERFYVGLKVSVG